MGIPGGDRVLGERIRGGPAVSVSVAYGRPFAASASAITFSASGTVTAFSSYFVVKHWQGAEFDAATGVNHERTEIRNEAGEAVMTDLWTGCYTPRELRLLSEANGLRVDSLSSVEPGAYALAPPTVESAEFLLLATRIH